MEKYNYQYIKGSLPKILNMRYILFYALVVMIMFYYSGIVQWLILKWIKDDNYSHGFLIPIISGYIAWRKRESIKSAYVQSSWTGLGIFLFGLLLEIIAVRADIKFLSGYAFILTIIGVILFSFGREITRIMLFPILFMIFMIPFPSFFTDPLSQELKKISAILSSNILYFMGISTLREGVVLHLAQGSIEVVDACSGLRSLLALFSLSCLFAYFSDIKLINKIILFFAAIPIAVIANVIRLVILSIILSTTGVIISEGFGHTLLGIFVLSICLMGLNQMRRILS